MKTGHNHHQVPVSRGLQTWARTACQQAGNVSRRRL